MKRIGLITPQDGIKLRFNMAYYVFAQQFGNVELIIPTVSKVDDLDLLILPGGEDVYPLRYGEAPLPNLCNSPNMDYEYFDQEILPNYIGNTPIFGICRGFQTLNVHFNGSLYQHLEDEPYSSTFRGDLVHGVANREGRFQFRINSLHHQGIKQLGHDLTPTLISTEKKGCIEAFKHNELPIAAVQFHPEELIFNDKAGAANAWIEYTIKSLIK